ncbi:MAG: alpha-glucan family phosphorylase [Armatimonadota bacterium]
MNKERKDLISYFSMEIGFDSTIPTYSGGLGVLAGDTLKSCADLCIPTVAITLLHRQGYFDQKMDSANYQVELPVAWDPLSKLEPLDIEVELIIDSKPVKIRAWKYDLKGQTGFSVPIYFLDTWVEGNSHFNKMINKKLYDSNPQFRISQEMILGIGGVKMLRALGYSKEEIKIYHMNEGHASFLTLELLKEFNYNKEEVKKRCVLTTHTPVPAGHDVFDYGIAKKIMGDSLPDNIGELSTRENLHTTILALNLSSYANAVSKKHQQVTQRMFPFHKIENVTNGVHSLTWTSESFRNLFDEYLPGWSLNPVLLKKSGNIPKEKVWEAHMEAKSYLLELVNGYHGVNMQEDILTIGYARRITSYKRATLIFNDLVRLAQIAKGKIQLVFAGKAHPDDQPGKMIIRELMRNQEIFRDRIQIAYLQNYNMDLARLIISGVDVWLNTPVRPREASGTSGMKALLNGGLNFSTLDGWWIEGYQMDDLAGWEIGPEPTEDYMVEIDPAIDADSLYDRLGTEIIPLYYNSRENWIERMQHAISLGSYFNTHRMVEEYAKNAWHIDIPNLKSTMA